MNGDSPASIVILKNRLSKGLLAAFVGALLAAGIGLCLHLFRIGLALTYTSYDLLLVARGERHASEALIIYLDETSHDKLKQSPTAPWDRALHARLIERLTAAGAKAIVFDIIFNDPITNNPAGDLALAEAMKASGRVILAADRVPIGPKQSKTKPPFPLLLESAADIGSAEVTPNRDLVIREHTPEAELYSLNWAAAKFIGAKATERGAVGYGTHWLNYYGPPKFLPWKSYQDALEPSRVPDPVFSNKVVFVGAQLITKFAGERKDEYRSPFGLWSTREMDEERGAMFVPGVEIQATAFLNLLRGDWLVRLPSSAERAIIVVLGLLMGFGLVQCRPLIAVSLAIGGAALIAVAAYFLFVRGLTWFPWLIIETQIVIAVSWSIVFNSIQLYVQKRMYEHTLSLYLSPKLVKKFARDPELLKPGAKEQTLTILFTDIANFSELSQRISSDELAKLMNDYFHTAVTKCIHKTDGTVVKYIGDAIFAFWNAPDQQEDHALRACEAALLFREHGVQHVNGEPLRTRIGLHTGAAKVGNFGSSERFDYTALGQAINLASRLEGLNRFLGTDCIISRDTKNEIGDRLVTRSLGMFQLKGFDSPVEVYELVGWRAEEESTRSWREAFAQGLSNYNNRDLEFAGAGFRQTLELRPNDGPSKFYLAKLEELAAENLPEDWATHTVLKEK